MKVLVIPEDFRRDQYMLKPIITAMIRATGMSARVEICRDPLLGGVSEALKWERIQDIIEQYKWQVQLFRLCVDRDGIAGRRSSLDRIEQNAARVFPSNCLLLAENAWQEIEVWVLAGHDLPNEWNWQDIRSEPDAKERFYEPFARMREVIDMPGEGRGKLAEQAARRYPRIRQLCPEDIAALEERIRTRLLQ